VRTIISCSSRRDRARKWSRSRLVSSIQWMSSTTTTVRRAFDTPLSMRATRSNSCGCDPTVGADIDGPPRTAASRPVNKPSTASLSTAATRSRRGPNNCLRPFTSSLIAARGSARAAPGEQLACTRRTVSSARRAVNSSTSRVLPMPASPTTTATDGWPLAVAATSSLSSASCSSRPCIAADRGSTISSCSTEAAQDATVRRAGHPQPSGSGRRPPLYGLRLARTHRRRTALDKTSAALICGIARSLLFPLPVHGIADNRSRRIRGQGTGVMSRSWRGREPRSGKSSWRAARVVTPSNTMSTALAFANMIWAPLGTGADLADNRSDF
jgi:hypothetical protein